MNTSFRPDCPPSSFDWDYFRPIIVQLYLNETKSLQEVQQTLVQKYGFTASYKNPVLELDYTLRLTNSPAIQTSNLQAQALSMATRSRPSHDSRSSTSAISNLSDTTVLDSLPSLTARLETSQECPGDRECVSTGTVPKVILHEEKYNKVHSILLATEAFTTAAAKREAEHPAPATRNEFRRRPDYVWSLFQHGLTMLEQDQVAKGFDSLQRGCSVTGKHFLQPPKFVILSFLVVMGSARWKRHENLHQELLRFLASMSGNVLGKQHPLTHILHQTRSVDLMPLWSESAVKVILEHTERRLGMAHPDVLFAVQILCIEMMRRQDYEGGEKLLRDAWLSSSSRNGPYHPVTRRVMRRLGNLYVERQRLAEAETIFEEVISRDQSESGSLDEISIITCDNLSMVSALQGHYLKSEYWADRKLEMALKRWGPEDPYYVDSRERRDARSNGAPLKQWFSWLEIT